MKTNRARPPPFRTGLMRFPAASKRDAAIGHWFRDQPAALAALARQWFAVMRKAGDDVRELLHDDHPMACVGDAAFAYVDIFTAHVNVGFFRGAALDDPDGLLEGAGKFMRHVKLTPGRHVDPKALEQLIHTAYRDMAARVAAEARLSRLHSSNGGR